VDIFQSSTFQWPSQKPNAAIFTLKNRQKEIYDPKNILKVHFRNFSQQKTNFLNIKAQKKTEYNLLTFKYRTYPSRETIP
jgi:hypothetical protein